MAKCDDNANANDDDDRDGSWSARAGYPMGGRQKCNVLAWVTQPTGRVSLLCVIVGLSLSLSLCVLLAAATVMLSFATTTAAATTNTLTAATLATAPID